MLMNPNAPMNQMPQMPFPKQSHTSFFVAIIMTLGFISALGFGIWAFIGMQDNKTNLDAKIEKASKVAVQNAEEAKEVEFGEREKDPYRTYTGSATYGSLSFSYPKTWSVLLDEKPSGTVMELYGNPFLLPSLSGQDSLFAFRAQILSATYDTEVDKFTKLPAGKVSITAFRPELVPSELGVRISGEISQGKQGVIVYLPLRDKTFKFWTESTDYTADFDKVMQTINYIP